MIVFGVGLALLVLFAPLAIATLGELEILPRSSLRGGAAIRERLLEVAAIFHVFLLAALVGAGHRRWWVCRGPWSVWIGPWLFSAWSLPGAYFLVRILWVAVW
jgi:hypothetical protein